ncbi:type III polyketide synthase [Altererythrobacter confluentis]|uniref:Type III polyketide synthase n=1 Tax=Allopontixanthobacter confluentis TaxID=1849021 RepID=A0A6L7GEP0_9SPHN|nr:type III polyketide synthase [Allopontixanthobacter confluentis]MXP14493.1 type III polyketide synthase [Allopontixanthobacter confluentis]
MARINALATAIPELDFEQDYRRWALLQLEGQREAKLYERMADRSGIEHRWSVLSAQDARLHQGEGLYGGPDAPGTAQRMQIYATAAPELALKAIAKLPDLGRITHIVVSSCTGFVAPGVDQIIARRLGLADDVERVLIGFMGCYAAVTALRTARHIVRSEAEARVLVVTVELSTLHHQQEIDIEPLLAGAQFGDGAAAAIVSASGAGLELHSGIAAALEDSADLITWDIIDTGFKMRLSGDVPNRIAAAIARPEVRAAITGGLDVSQIDAWAIHAGGRSILDAVENGLELARGSLEDSRAVLRECGNMSSSTLMFVLERIMKHQPARGVALAFGPGLAMEGLHFGWTGGD